VELDLILNCGITSTHVPALSPKHFPGVFIGTGPGIKREGKFLAYINGVFTFKCINAFRFALRALYPKQVKVMQPAVFPGKY